MNFTFDSYRNLWRSELSRRNFDLPDLPDFISGSPSIYREECIDPLPPLSQVHIGGKATEVYSNGLNTNLPSMDGLPHSEICEVLDGFSFSFNSKIVKKETQVVPEWNREENTLRFSIPDRYLGGKLNLAFHDLEVQMTTNVPQLLLFVAEAQFRLGRRLAWYDLSEKPYIQILLERFTCPETCSDIYPIMDYRDFRLTTYSEGQIVLFFNRLKKISRRLP